jgi:hypothetical protein
MTDALFLAAMLLPPASVVVAVLALLAPGRRAEARIHEHRVDLVSH